MKITHYKRKGHRQNLRGKKGKQSMQKQAVQSTYLTPQVYLSGQAVMSTNDGKGFFMPTDQERTYQYHACNHRKSTTHG